MSFVIFCLFIFARHCEFWGTVPQSAPSRHLERTNWGVSTACDFHPRYWGQACEGVWVSVSQSRESPQEIASRSKVWQWALSSHLGGCCFIMFYIVFLHGSDKQSWDLRYAKSQIQFKPAYLVQVHTLHTYCMNDKCISVHGLSNHGGH